jgi:hypothetical protein
MPYLFIPVILLAETSILVAISLISLETLTASWILLFSRLKIVVLSGDDSGMWARPWMMMCNGRTMQASALSLLFAHSTQLVKPYVRVGVGDAGTQILVYYQLELGLQAIHVYC